MKLYSFLTNKYTLSVIILLFCLGVDIILHKGMSRVILPESFTENRVAREYATCEQQLVVTNKKWMKAVNSVERLQQLDSSLGGFETDVYFDTIKNYFKVYHDSSTISELNLDAILQHYKKRNLNSSLWLDFKNLSVGNLQASLQYVSKIRQDYNLRNKIIVESSRPELLQPFCDSGFFTSYYLPFFNPYQMGEKALVAQIDSIAVRLQKNKVSALSGYYFQYPVMTKYFPKYPVLTWSDNSNISLVTNSFNRSLLSDSHVKVVLFAD